MLNITTIPKSNLIKGLVWEGDRIPYPEKEILGDTYPVTWAHDDHIYTSSGDPEWGGKMWGLDAERFEGGPLDYKIVRTSPMLDFDGGGGYGPKPTGMICVNGVVYLAVQNLRNLQIPPHGVNSQHGSDAGILYTTTGGFYWAPAFQNIKAPMFPGHKFGGPSFINFGKNNANARDECVYAVSSDQWDNGSNMRLGRVAADTIMDAIKWEWVCAWKADGQPVFGGKLEEAIPILSVHKSIGVPEMVYAKGINRYLLFTWRLRRDFTPGEGTDLMVMESPEPWGPFSLVHIEHEWEGREFTPYCPRVPLKWMDEDGKAGWLLFSGSWSPEGKAKLYYRANIRRFRLVMDDA